MFARGVVGKERLAQPSLVVRDEARGRAENMPGGAIVALQPDHRSAGEISLEAQDVIDLRAAPAIDRLVVTRVRETFSPSRSSTRPLAGGRPSPTIETEWQTCCTSARMCELSRTVTPGLAEVADQSRGCPGCRPGRARWSARRGSAGRGLLSSAAAMARRCFMPSE